MKTNTLLALTSLALLASTASAASDKAGSTPYVLPTYVVSTPRYEEAELKIRARLAELRQQASAPVAIPSELPLPKAPASQADKLAEAFRLASVKLVAKS